jgi:hypothetical protein
MYEVTDINKRAERCIILFVQALLNNAIFFTILQKYMTFTKFCKTNK